MISTMPAHSSLRAILRRLLILGGAAVLLWLALSWLPSPSERFHAILVPLWVLNFVLAKQRLSKNSLILGAGLLLGLVGFYGMGAYQAHLLGARFAWQEPLVNLWFTLGLFVIYNLLCTALEGLIALIPAARKVLPTPRGWWLRWLRMSVAMCLFAPYLYVSFNIHRFKYGNATNPQQAGLRFEAVNFKARDGVRLQGWFLPNTRAKATVIVVHGIGSNRGDLLSVAPFLHRGGFNVFLFDLRGHGESAGHTTTFGVNEARDVEAAARFVKERTSNQKVGLYGFSMGGSSVLHAIGDFFHQENLSDVRAVVLDSTFSEFAPLARQQMNFLPEGAARPLLALMSFYTRLEIGVGLEEIVPGRFIGQIAPRPLLLIHGTGDSLIPPGQARLNFSRANEPKTMYWVEGAEHCAGHYVAGERYEKRVNEFFREALGQP